MSVATHLTIGLADYDACIGRLIPGYERALEAAALTLATAAPSAGHVLDLGTGTGALVARCSARLPRAAFTGLDADPAMLEGAARRLAEVRIRLVHADFLRAILPACDAATASFALHHVPTRVRKVALYARLHAALRPGGVLVNADCAPSSDRVIAAADRRAWRAFLADAHGPARANAFLRAWAREDVYFTLDQELAMMRAAEFVPDVTWRLGAFAVICGRKPVGRSGRR